MGDWENGDDPQYSKYIPVWNLDDVEMLRNAELTTHFGVLHRSTLISRLSAAVLI
jgi:hypothetical protein